MTTVALNARTAAQSMDLGQLRDHLLALRRVTSRSSQTAPASVARDLGVARRVAQCWSPLTRDVLVNGLIRWSQQPWRPAPLVICRQIAPTREGVQT
jgi:hypothetical protein